MRPIAIAMLLTWLPGAALAQNIDVRERAYPDTMRVIVGSANTGHWAPAYGVRGTRAQQEQNATAEAMRLCAANPGSPTDCQVLHVFGPGPACGTVARSQGRIAGGSGASPDAARAAAVAACQRGGARCVASNTVYCYR